MRVSGSASMPCVEARLTRHDLPAQRTAGTIAQLASSHTARRSILGPLCSSDSRAVAADSSPMNEKERVNRAVAATLTDHSRQRKLHRLGIFCGISAALWLAGAEAPT